MESYYLQLVPGGVPLVLHASQYDSARDYQFTPMYGSSRYGYQSGAKAYVEATKPDKTIVQEEATYNTDGTIYYKPSEVLYQAAGDVRMKVVIVDKNNQTLASATVTLAVDLAGITTYAQISKSDLSLLHETSTKLSTIDASVTEAQTQASRAKSWAVGPSGTGTDGTDTNNSWYWARQASSSASASATSADNAKTSEETAFSHAIAASASAEDANTSETNAKASETAAKTSETNAKASETAAANSASAAKTSETNAKASEANALRAEKNILDAEPYAIESHSWAVGGTGSRDGEDTNNSKYWAMVAIASQTGVTSLNEHGGEITLSLDSSSGDIVLSADDGKTGSVSLNGNGGILGIYFDSTGDMVLTSEVV